MAPSPTAPQRPPAEQLEHVRARVEAEAAAQGVDLHADEGDAFASVLGLAPPRRHRNIYRCGACGSRSIKPNGFDHGQVHSYLKCQGCGQTWKAVNVDHEVVLPAD